MGARKSDMGKLLRNCLRWLATSPGSSGIGGYITPPKRWLSPNDDPAIAQQVRKRHLCPLFALIFHHFTKMGSGQT